MEIKFKTESYSFSGKLNDTLTAKEIINQLPLESVISLWGDEIYFNIGFKASAEGASMEVGIGDIAYWSQGKSLCVFFGPTPASSAEKPVPASPVVVIGKTDSPQEDLRKIKFGEKIVIYRE